MLRLIAIDTRNFQEYRAKEEPSVRGHSSGVMLILSSRISCAD
jgi:hypothetical protein